jgi:hypothetical protein
LASKLVDVLEEEANAILPPEWGPPTNIKVSHLNGVKVTVGRISNKSIICCLGSLVLLAVIQARRLHDIQLIISSCCSLLQYPLPKDVRDGNVRDYSNHEDATLANAI